MQNNMVYGFKYFMVPSPRLLLFMLVLFFSWFSSAATAVTGESAQAAYENGRYAEAKTQFGYLVREFPNTMIYQYGLARTLFQTGDYNVALTYLDRVLHNFAGTSQGADAVERVDMLLLRAKIYHMKNQFKRVIKDADEVLTISGNNRAALYLLASSYKKLGDNERSESYVSLADEIE